MSKSNYLNDVHQVAELIPKGRVTSYGAIAEYLGMKSGARLVGWAMNAAHSNPKVPAHRVVNRNGLLTGKAHFATPTRMQELLEAEGIKVLDEQVVNFQNIFWNPLIEL